MNWQDREAPERTKTKAPPKTAQIIVQYRSKQGKVYELESAGTVLSVCIGYPREGLDPPGCLVGAQALSRGELAKVEARADTAAHALGEVARAWRSQVPALMPLDWEAVQLELRAVHAI
jgi:hypothetical protein